MGLIDGLHNVPERFKRCCSSLAPPPTNNNNNKTHVFFYQSSLKIYSDVLISGLNQTRRNCLNRNRSH